jgi:hypothetical protein
MIVYNVTVSIDPEVHEAWIAWMKDVHIPEVLATGFFLENRIMRVHGEDEGVISYAFQYLLPDMDSLLKYQQEHAPRLQKDHSERFQGRFAAFRTVLEVVQHTTV